MCIKSINNAAENEIGVSKHKKIKENIEIQLTFLQFLPRCYGWLYLVDYKNVSNKTTNLTSIETVS